MSREERTTRRRFFGQAGAALSVPMTGAAANARNDPSDDSAARLAALEGANAIRALQREYLRLINAGAHAEAALLFATPAAAPLDASVRRLAADRFTSDDAIEVAPGGATASARLECTVETESAIGGRGSYTLVDMLHGQGEAALRTLGRGVLECEYVKQNGVWKISRLDLRVT